MEPQSHMIDTTSNRQQLSQQEQQDHRFLLDSRDIRTRQLGGTLAGHSEVQIDILSQEDMR